MALIKVNTRGQSSNLGRRNILINGAFQNWQRGTSFNSNVYGSDRWKFYAPGSHAYSRSTDTPDYGLATEPTGFEFSASLGGSGDATGLTQFVESRNSKHIPISGSTKVILSFYLKHTTNSGTAKITSSIGTLDSADSSGATTTRSTQNHNTTTGWVRYTHETTGATLTSAAGNGVQVTIKHNGSGTTAFLLTGCQLEISELVTPFEHRSVGEELSLCQRYYHQANFTAGPHYGGGAIAMYAFNANEAGGTTTFPVTMRAAPAVRTKDAAGNIGGIHRAAVANVTSGVAIGWSGNADANTKGISGLNKTGAWATGNVLIGGYEADAEI